MNSSSTLIILFFNTLNNCLGCGNIIIFFRRLKYQFSIDHDNLINLYFLYILKLLYHL
jgi:hypothetical protein